ncbi:MAG: aminopeptidase P N-terminal domain-containing protein [Bacteroidales bacterium]|nr:aminopeptidase P N-terminal domain-containing protein [Bacteroidales bacterium]MDD4209061.1 aminopeptidase P N-terminal domain-containing protein [Bacteroidales bacterium]
MKYQEIETSFFINNRKKLISYLDENALVLLSSNDEMPETGDQCFPFRQNADFFYLTGIDQEKSILALCPHHPNPQYREVLFLLQTNETIAVWNGYKYTIEHAQRVSGIQNVQWLSSFDTLLKEMAYASEKIYLNLQENYRFSTEVERQELRLCKKIQQLFPLHTYGRLSPLFTHLRLRKEAVEIALIQKACDITGKALHRILQFVKPGVMEYEIEAEMIHEFIRLSATGHAFAPIIASGKDTCVLHYIKNNKMCQDGDLLLLDFGASYANYAGDLSRTIPVNGTYSPRQKQVYDACWRVYEFAKTLYVPGMTINKINKRVFAMMETEFVKLGLFTQQEADQQDKITFPLVRKYFMHNIGHFMGINTHDVGDRDVIFEEGMIASCEPGIYIPEEGIGVRIETDMLISKKPIDLMANVPSNSSDIEKIMKG